MDFILLDTALSRLHKQFGDDKISKELLLQMLKSMEVTPYTVLGRDYISSFHLYEITAAILDYPKGAPVDEIFDIGI